jgi:hypothetical protein
LNHWVSLLLSKEEPTSPVFFAYIIWVRSNPAIENQNGLERLLSREREIVHPFAHLSRAGLDLWNWIFTLFGTYPLYHSVLVLYCVCNYVWVRYKSVFTLKIHWIDVFLVLYNDFDVLMSKIKNKIRKKFILMHFQVKCSFEKHLKQKLSHSEMGT